MNFFKAVAGLFLYIGTLAVPVEESTLQIRISSADDDDFVRVRSIFEFGWSDESTEIVNSAIPIIIKYTLKVGTTEQELIKVLRKQITDNDYFVIDSADGEKSEKTYPNIQLALRNFRQTEWEIPAFVERIDLTAEIEKSFVSSMNMYADISPIFGGTKFVRKVPVKKEKRNR